MMAVLAGTAVEVDAILLHFLGKGADAELIDPISECFDSAALRRSFSDSIRTPPITEWS